jgi:hypothetical protein
MRREILHITLGKITFWVGETDYTVGHLVRPTSEPISIRTMQIRYRRYRRWLSAWVAETDRRPRHISP